MDPKNQVILDDEIDLKKIIISLWKEKFLILIITLIFVVVGYFYGILKPKVYQTNFILRDAPDSEFGRYNLLFF